MSFVHAYLMPLVNIVALSLINSLTYEIALLSAHQDDKTPPYQACFMILFLIKSFFFSFLSFSFFLGRGRGSSKTTEEELGRPSKTHAKLLPRGTPTKG